ncbi:MAG TPA: TIGR03089 family protein [Frankiaceae bacterium]|nr:TIGR03089 family protein [Frankiaceae bacterium]
MPTDLSALLAALPPDTPAPHPGIAAVLAARVAADPAGPLLTFYDDATGERTELSAATVDNWVAKTANLLVDGLGVTPGDPVAVLLPLHWQAAVVLLAVWSAGATVAAAGAVAAAAFVAEDRLDAAPEAGELVGLSLRPLAGRLCRVWPGVLDYAEEVPAYGDRFAAPPPGREQADLVRLVAATAGRFGLAAADRVLTTAAFDTAEGLLGGLLAPLSAGSSVVLCRHPDPAALPRRLRTERVTAVCGELPPGTDVPGTVRRLVP